MTASDTEFVRMVDLFDDAMKETLTDPELRRWLAEDCAAALADCDE